MRTSRRPPAFEGLIVRPARAGRRPGATARRLATLAEATLNGKWRARALGPRAKDFLLEPARRRDVAPGAAWDMVAKLRALREVRDVEPAFTLPGLPDDPRAVVAVTGIRPTRGMLFRERHLRESDDCEWSVRMCRGREAWAFSTATRGAAAQGAGIVVAHPDTGYTTHPAIFDVTRLLTGEGYDFFDDVADAADPLVGRSPGHGTSTASVIMSASGSSSDTSGALVTGMAPAASLVPLRVNDSVVHFSYARLCEALYHAVDRKCHVVSMSLGGPWGSGALARAIRHAVDRGLILIAASGNYWPWVVYPAKYDDVLAVSACNARRKMWAHASTGDSVAVTAPGESVWRAWAKDLGDYRIARSSGTSYATATTAGACALWLAHHGRAKLRKRYGAARLASVFREVLQTAGVRRPAGWNRHEWGAGIVDARKLLGAPLPAAVRAAAKRKRPVRPAPEPANDLDTLAQYFPGAGTARVQRALARLFDTDVRGLEKVLAEVGDELRFHLSIDADLRDAVISAGKWRAATRLRSPRKLFAGASKALRGRLAPR